MAEKLPVGSTGGGRHAPMLEPERNPFDQYHFCEAVGSGIYCSESACPHCRN